VRLPRGASYLFAWASSRVPFTSFCAHIQVADMFTARITRARITRVSMWEPGFEG
jgi:hypothetical protein